MATNVEITRNSGESSLSTLRRFSRKVQSAGVIPRMRSIRYSGRVQSPYKVKQKALKRLAATRPWRSSSSSARPRSSRSAAAGNNERLFHRQ